MGKLKRCWKYSAGQAALEKEQVKNSELLFLDTPARGSEWAREENQGCCSFSAMVFVTQLSLRDEATKQNKPFGSGQQTQIISWKH